MQTGSTLAGIVKRISGSYDKNLFRLDTPLTIETLAPESEL